MTLWRVSQTSESLLPGHDIEPPLELPQASGPLPSMIPDVGTVTRLDDAA
ncbi:MAG: hypothetical protein V5A55_11890 [Halovenus sp.]